MRTATIVLTSLLLMLSITPERGAGQSPPPPQIGATVRVMAPPPDEWRQGRLDAIDGERIVVSRGSRSSMRYRVDTIPLRSVARLEVRRSRVRAHRVIAGGALGAVVGGLLGGALGSSRDGGSSGYVGDGMGRAVGLLGGALLGAVGGALVGASTGGEWTPAAIR